MCPVFRGVQGRPAVSIRCFKRDTGSSVYCNHKGHVTGMVEDACDGALSEMRVAMLVMECWWCAWQKVVDGACDTDEERSFVACVAMCSTVPMLGA